MADTVVSTVGKHTLTIKTQKYGSGAEESDLDNNSYTKTITVLAGVSKDGKAGLDSGKMVLNSGLSILSEDDSGNNDSRNAWDNEDDGLTYYDVPEAHTSFSSKESALSNATTSLAMPETIGTDAFSGSSLNLTDSLGISDALSFGRDDSIIPACAFVAELADQFDVFCWQGAASLANT